MTAGARQVFPNSLSIQSVQSMNNMNSSSTTNVNGNGNGNSSSSGSGASGVSPTSSVDSHSIGIGGLSMRNSHQHQHQRSQSHANSILFGQITRTMNNQNHHSHNSVMSVLDSSSNLSNIMGGGGGIKKTNNKPLMEKRRRARINKSLLELERLIILPNQDLKKGAAAKLEKADILEMTVKYLREVCDVQESHANKWKAGFNECAKIVKQYLEENGNTTLSQQLTSHLLAVDNPPPGFIISVPDSEPERDLPVQLELSINCNHSSESELDSGELQPVNLAKYKPSENESMWRPWSFRPPGAGAGRFFNGNGNGFDLSPLPFAHPRPSYSEPDHHSS